YESIGKPLPGRRNIVLSSTISASDASGIEVVRSISEAKELLNNTGILMVIGGAGVYRACLPEADTLHLTIIHGDFEGDTFFPDWSHLPFKKTATESFFSDSLKLGYEFETWKKSV
ncbi:MAG TPA: diacylglycerol kinase, partial [Succinivibrionaceae bacterium]|nr:diacylglycerol kinase [Succinivibrionaceae bacterium]